MLRHTWNDTAVQTARIYCLGVPLMRLVKHEIGQTALLNELDVEVHARLPRRTARRAHEFDEINALIGEIDLDDGRGRCGRLTRGRGRCRGGCGCVRSDEFECDEKAVAH
jgi:hypothetical protein